MYVSSCVGVFVCILRHKHTHTPNHSLPLRCRVDDCVTAGRGSLSAPCLINFTPHFMCVCVARVCGLGCALWLLPVLKMRANYSKMNVKYLKGDRNIGRVLPQKVGGGGFSRKGAGELWRVCDRLGSERERIGGVLLFLWDVDVNLKVELQRITDESCCHCVWVGVLRFLGYNKCVCLAFNG